MRVSQGTRTALRRHVMDAGTHSEVAIDAETLLNLLDDIEDIRQALLALSGDARRPTTQTPQDVNQYIIAQLERWAVGMAE